MVHMGKMGKITKYLPSAIMTTSIATPLIYMAYMYQKDDRQQQHAILRNFPLLGRVRYISEHVGPELRQYLFADDNEGKPFSRLQYQDVRSEERRVGKECRYRWTRKQ